MRHTLRRFAPVWVASVLVWAACVLASCGEPGAERGSEQGADPSRAQAPEAPEERVLLVFAAASLREVFGALEARFEAEHPGVEVTLQLAGTQELRAQIEAGAPADVLASADVASMDALAAAGRVESPTIFAYNVPVLVVSREAGDRVRTFEELPRAERIVVGAPEVPIGRYTARIFEAADARFGEGFAARVERRIVSREPNVRQVLAKVALGEADAGIVYRTDVLGTRSDVTVLMIPPGLAPEVAYPIARVRGAAHPHLAQAWIALVAGPQGRAVLADAGFSFP